MQVCIPKAISNGTTCNTVYILVQKICIHISKIRALYPIIYSMLLNVNIQFSSSVPLKVATQIPVVTKNFNSFFIQSILFKCCSTYSTKSSNCVLNFNVRR